jgi:hypothetical protein
VTMRHVSQRTIRLIEPKFAVQLAVFKENPTRDRQIEAKKQKRARALVCHKTGFSAMPMTAAKIVRGR